MEHLECSLQPSPPRAASLNKELSEARQLVEGRHALRGEKPNRSTLKQGWGKRPVMWGVSATGPNSRTEQNRSGARYKLTGSGSSQPGEAVPPSWWSVARPFGRRCGVAGAVGIEGTMVHEAWPARRHPSSLPHFVYARGAVVIHRDLLVANVARGETKPSDKHASWPRFTCVARTQLLRPRGQCESTA